jgi:hypothetical protein
VIAPVEVVESSALGWFRGAQLLRPMPRCLVCSAGSLCFDVELARHTRGDGESTRDVLGRLPGSKLSWVVGSWAYQGIDKKELLSGRDWVKQPLFNWPDWTTPWQGWSFGRDGVEQSPPLGEEFRRKLRQIERGWDPEKCARLIPCRRAEEDTGLEGSRDLEKLLIYLVGLFNDKARRVHFLFPFPAVPEPPAGYLERWAAIPDYRPRQDPYTPTEEEKVRDKLRQGVTLPSLCRAWHPATYRVMGRRERYSGLDPSEVDDLNFEQYHICDTEISVSAPSSVTKKDVAQHLFHDKIWKQITENRKPVSDAPAEYIQRHIDWLEDDVQTSARYVARICSEYEEAVEWGIGFEDGPYELIRPKSVPPEEFRLRPTVSELRWWDKILGIPREPSGCRFKFIYNGEDREEGDDNHVPDFDPVVSGVERSEDDEEAPPKQHDYVFFDSPETTKNHVDRSNVDAAMALNAAGGDYHNLGEPVTKEENGVKVNTENTDFKSDSYIREWMFTNPSKDPDDDGQWIEETARRLGMKVGTFRTRIWRFRRRVDVMDEQSNVPKDAPKLTYEQAVDIADCGAAYILVQLPQKKWRWYKLDLEGGRTVDEAIEVLKDEKVFEAIRKKFTGDFAHDQPILQAKQDGIEKAFLPVNRRVVGPIKPQWAGVLSALADE